MTYITDLKDRIKALEHERDKALDDAEKWSAAHDKKEAELRDQVHALQASRSKLSATLRLLCGDLIALSTESAGVAGWHKNGQIAAWDTFEGMMRIAHDYHDKKEFDRLGKNYMAEGIRMIFDEDLVTRYYDDEFDAEFVLLPDVDDLLKSIEESDSE